MTWEMVVASFDDPIAGGLCGEQPTAPPPGTTLLIARDRLGAAGVAGVRGLHDGCAEIERLYVRPCHQGLGLDRLLLAGAEELARRRGYPLVRLSTRTAGLCESRGYVRIAPFGGYRPPDVCFEKVL